MKKKKTLHYLVAEFSNDDAHTLEEYIRELYLILKTVENRTILISNKYYSLSLAKPYDDSFAIQIVSYVKGEKSTIIPTEHLSSRDLKLDESAPPEGKDFSEGDIICLISRNDVYTCASMLRWAILEKILHELLSKNELIKFNDVKFKIVRPTRLDKLRLIKEQGVKKIHLSVGLSTLSHYSSVENENQSLLSTVINALRSKTPREAVNGRESKMKIDLPMVNFSDEFALNEATKVLDEGFTFCIETKKGVKITAEDITFFGTSSIESLGKSVYFDDAITALMDFKNETGKNINSI